MGRSWILILLFSAAACCSAEIGPQDRQNIMDIIGSGAHDGDPELPEYVTKYAQQHKLRQQDVESFLLALVKTHAKRKAPECAYGLAALSLLVAYRARWALPELEAELLKSGDLVSDPLIRSIVRLGGPNLPRFACEMLDFEKTPRMQRHALYEELSAYVGVDTVRPEPLPGNKSRDPALKDEVLQLLESALKTEPDLYHRRRIKAILVAATADPASAPKEDAGAQSPGATPERDMANPPTKPAPSTGPASK